MSDKWCTECEHLGTGEGLCTSCVDDKNFEPKGDRRAGMTEIREKREEQIKWHMEQIEIAVRQLERWAFTEGYQKGYEDGKLHGIEIEKTKDLIRVGDEVENVDTHERGIVVGIYKDNQLSVMFKQYEVPQMVNANKYVRTCIHLNEMDDIMSWIGEHG